MQGQLVFGIGRLLAGGTQFLYFLGAVALIFEDTIRVPSLLPTYVALNSSSLGISLIAFALLVVAYTSLLLVRGWADSLDSHIVSRLFYAPTALAIGINVIIFLNQHIRLL